jgi:hypothetical protein
LKGQPVGRECASVPEFADASFQLALLALYWYYVSAGDRASRQADIRRDIMSSRRTVNCAPQRPLRDRLVTQQQGHGGTFNEIYARLAAPGVAAFAAMLTAPAHSQNNFIFKMVPTGGVEACIPGAKGRVTVTTLGVVENMHVEVSGLPPATDFDLFVIQVPTSPFGISWYLADMSTDGKGVAVGDFTGRFNRETFIVAPGAAPAPKTFPDDATINPPTAPIQTYHLGLWFDSATDAGKAGCSTNVTPFNGTHNAGVQILNTSNFPATAGPLLHAP